ncbi:MAG: helix-turn-helix transcriptional regulator [Desulfobacteraceae bacterium]|nr:helix-turn-helix transcriptional regulator [Desulfobacteraceae bacterium]
MEYGIYTKIAKGIGKSPSFVSQYFNKGKKMSWDTSKKAAKAFPFTKAEWWADKKLDLINEAFSATTNTDPILWLERLSPNIKVASKQGSQAQ